MNRSYCGLSSKFLMGKYTIFKLLSLLFKRKTGWCLEPSVNRNYCCLISEFLLGKTRFMLHCSFQTEDRVVSKAIGES